MEVEELLPSPIRGVQQNPHMQILSQGNPMNDSLNSEQSVRDPSFMYNQTTIISNQTLTNDITVLGGTQTEEYQLTWSQPGQPNLG